MTFRTKIFGAGSIGNHLGNAARVLDWEVDLCDVDVAALERTKADIYPTRYGAWDDAIGLYPAGEAPRGGYDLICVGTPPDSHMDLAMAALDEEPRALLIEKPLCGAGLDGMDELHERASAGGTQVFVGYDHILGKATQMAVEHLMAGGIGAIETMDVEFREYWGGIFAAHPWLDGPADSYLGYWRRGGGASGEHSHALNLWQHFAHVVGAGRVVEVGAMAHYVADGPIDYDKIMTFNLKSESGMTGRVVQDVVTSPARKWGRIQGDNGYVEWNFGFEPGKDQTKYVRAGDEPREHSFEKSRPDDFIAELRHIRDVIENGVNESPISLERGLDTMLVIAAGHRSALENRVVAIDYTRGYRSAALQIL
jgi:predicted dehydrogenase